ncbi:MAG: CDP-alcohol phosphatidyltransferase family protein, partial [Pseudobdellovibrionaceae bacterium]
MISTYLLKKRFQDFLRPCSRALLSSGVTPNHVTLATMLGSVVFAVALARISKNTYIFLSVPV